MEKVNCIRLSLKLEKKLIPEDLIKEIRSKKIISFFSDYFPSTMIYSEDDEFITFIFNLETNKISNIWLKKSFWKDFPYQITLETRNKTKKELPCRIETIFSEDKGGYLIIIIDTKNKSGIPKIQ